MSSSELHCWPGPHLDWPGQDDEHVYPLLEEARLRCEELAALARTGPARVSLREIAIIADDALSGTAQTDHMHLAHLQLLSAMGRLANHL